MVTATGLLTLIKISEHASLRSNLKPSRQGSLENWFSEGIARRANKGIPAKPPTKNNHKFNRTIIFPRLIGTRDAKVHFHLLFKNLFSNKKSWTQKLKLRS